MSWLLCLLAFACMILGRDRLAVVLIVAAAAGFFFLAGIRFMLLRRRRTLPRDAGAETRDNQEKTA